MRILWLLAVLMIAIAVLLPPPVRRPSADPPPTGRHMLILP